MDGLNTQDERRGWDGENPKMNEEDGMVKTPR